MDRQPTSKSTISIKQSYKRDPSYDNGFRIGKSRFDAMSDTEILALLEADSFNQAYDDNFSEHNVCWRLTPFDIDQWMGWEYAELGIAEDDIEAVISVTDFVLGLDDGAYLSLIHRLNQRCGIDNLGSDFASPDYPAQNRWATH